MSLRDCEIKKEYRSLIDNIIQDFYIPLLKNATVYKRAVGFFSSTSLVEISKGIAAMAEAGGKIQLVASPYLSEEDIEAIRKGYADRNEIIENALLGRLSDDKLLDYYSMERLNLLANLIANGILRGYVQSWPNGARLARNAPARSRTSSARWRGGSAGAWIGNASRGCTTLGLRSSWTTPFRLM